MQVVKLEEHGYESAALGFSLSFKTSIKRAKEIMPKYAWGKVPGENKFLRVIQIWLDVDIPRLLWPECDQYKVGTTTLSESTVHTLSKSLCTMEDFLTGTDPRIVDILNEKIVEFQNKKIDITELKANLPEGFLQRRVWNMNYANLQNIVCQRETHRVKLWNRFINELVPQMDYPEFIIRNYNKEG